MPRKRNPRDKFTITHTRTAPGEEIDRSPSDIRRKIWEQAIEDAQQIAEIREWSVYKTALVRTEILLVEDERFWQEYTESKHYPGAVRWRFVYQSLAKWDEGDEHGKVS